MGSSEAGFGAREDFGCGSGSLLEVVSFIVVVEVVVVVGTLCVVAFSAVLVGRGSGSGVDVVDGVGGSVVVVGFCTLT